MKRTSARIGRVSSIGTGSYQTSQCQESTAGVIGLPISAFPSMFLRSVEHCPVGELLCHVFARIAAVFLSMFSSNASIEVVTDPL